MSESSSAPSAALPQWTRHHQRQTPLHSNIRPFAVLTVCCSSTWNKLSVSYCRFPPAILRSPSQFQVPTPIALMSQVRTISLPFMENFNGLPAQRNKCIESWLEIFDAHWIDQLDVSHAAKVKSDPAALHPLSFKRFSPQGETFGQVELQLTIVRTNSSIRQDLPS